MSWYQIEVEADNWEDLQKLLKDLEESE